MPEVTYGLPAEWSEALFGEATVVGDFQQYLAERMTFEVEPPQHDGRRASRGPFRVRVKKPDDA